MKRADITCPEDNEPIELDKLSIKKWSEQIFFVWCPRCRTNHVMQSTPPNTQTGKGEGEI